ncbi:mechanosensitive ion channel [Pedobacter sp. SD-b]|uniref:Mechanosensitive ion channel n=1 Tax=Pedobacter segetis TaxID=2793069 RepID=A0ABS1BNC4_9SPHI|nr:mechanosensitive ion channel domain-containing protein [Pedobacter segetis]MBK0384388.1 mechanosensitive ion channel [Pedobacter segetis]
MGKRILFFLSFLVLAIAQSLYAQSLSQTLQNIIKKDSSKAKGSTQAIAADTTFNGLIKRVDYYAEKFNGIGTELSAGFDTLDISENLPQIEKRVGDANSYNLATFRSLSTLQDYFATSQKQLDKWANRLTVYNNSLVEMQEVLCGLTSDSVFKKLPADSALRNRFYNRLNELGGKWHRLDSISNKAILKIGILQNRVSAIQVKIVDFNDQINNDLKKLKQRAFTKEYDYLWDVSTTGFWNDLKTGINKTSIINYKILSYYFTYSYKVHLINIALFLLLYFWLKRNRDTIKKDGESADNIFNNTLLTTKKPIIAALAVTCTIGPFFYYRPPIIINQIYLVVLMFSVGILMWGIYEKWLIKNWFIAVLFVVLYSFGNLYFQVFESERLMFFLLTVMIFIWAVDFFRKRKSAIPEKYQNTISNVIYIFFALLGISILGNLFGRYSMAKAAATTALFTLVEGISLILFVKIITEGIYLQMEVGKIHINTISSYLDFKNLKDRIGKFLKVLAIILLVVFFTQNLNVFDAIYDSTKSYLTLSRKIGDTTFTFAGFILFILIIYLSTVIAKIISYFFEFADEHALKTSRRAKYSSSILLVRLFIWIIGFLIAIAASGVPMDRITIIIGALGVGIGFGLQNIVNNVVSGLVMVFEKPIQVGDLIEVGNKTGTVRSMGIRASKILTLEGSEVIIPNGDLLSQNLINWTLSNTHKRISLDVGVSYGSDIEKVKSIFKAIVEENEDVMKTPEPLIILDGFGDSAVNFRVLCWVADIDNWLTIKSILMSKVFEEFLKNDISIPFPQRDVNLYMKNDFGFIPKKGD